MVRSQLRERLQATFAPDVDWLLGGKRHKRLGVRRTFAAAIVGYLVVVGWLALGAIVALRVGAAGHGWATVVVVVFTFTALMPLMAVGSWLAGRHSAFRTFFLGLVPLLVVGICGSVALPELILQARGQEIAAKVAAVNQGGPGGGAIYYDYTLRSLDGRTLLGQLETSASTALRPVGAVIKVIVDPEGVAPPDLPGAVVTKAIVMTTVGVLGLLLLAAVIGYIAAHGERQLRLWHGRRPRTA
jgi:hypothetical protein